MSLVFSVFFIAIIGLMQALYVPTRDARDMQSQANVLATSALAYRESVISYLNSNPGFTGTVADAALTYPWGYTRDAKWTNVVNVNGLYVYEPAVSNNSYTIDSLYGKTSKSYSIGRNVGGVLVSANGLTTGIVIPAAVPQNAIVIAGK